MSGNFVKSLQGNSIQENDIRGIYLPLEWKSEETYKSPIVLCFNMNHFCPLLMQRDVPNGTSLGRNLLPLYNSELKPLPVKYILADEEGSDLVRSYLNVTSIMYMHNNKNVKVPCVRVEHREIYDDINIIKRHREHCEILLNEYQSNSPLRRNVLLKQNKNNQAQKPVQQEQHLNKSAPKCVSPSCEMYGDPDTGNMCYQCYLQYTREEAKRTGEIVREEPSAPPTPVDENYQSGVDLSMIGEDCKTPGCVYRCSVTTYPYCHECKYKRLDKSGAINRSQSLMQNSEYGKYNQVQKPVQQEQHLNKSAPKCVSPSCEMYGDPDTGNMCYQCYLQYTREEAKRTGEIVREEPSAPPTPVDENYQSGVDLSMIGEDCKTPGCVYRCSVTTYPYCHECKYKRLDKSGAINRSQSLMQNSEYGSIVMQPQEETKKAENNEDERSLFGEGDDLVVNKQGFDQSSGRIQSSNSKDSVLANLDEGEFNHLSSLESNPDHLSLTAVEQTCVVNKKAPTTESSEGTPSPGEIVRQPFFEGLKTPPVQLPQNAGSVPSSSQQAYNGYVPSHAVNQDPAQNATPKDDFEITNCSMPTCQGLRINGEHCIKCIEKSTPLVSMSPEITTAEYNEIKPVVKSSKDKIRCASDLCNRKIYPPRKLCEECHKILSAHYTKDPNGGRSLEQHRRKTQHG